MDGFIPDTPRAASQTIVYYEDALAKDGWKGQATGKSLNALKSELSVAIGRLGGVIGSFQSGSWGTGKEKRVGYRIHFSISEEDGIQQPGQLDVAALPVRPQTSRHRKSLEQRQEESLRMALFMTVQAFEGMWFLRQLAPGFQPMLPWLLTNSGHTINELYLLRGHTATLLPAGMEDFEEGEFSE
jgi:hypothetical protein